MTPTTIKCQRKSRLQNEFSRLKLFIFMQRLQFSKKVLGGKIILSSLQSHQDSSSNCIFFIDILPFTKNIINFCLFFSDSSPRNFFPLPSVLNNFHKEPTQANSKFYRNKLRLLVLWKKLFFLENYFVI